MRAVIFTITIAMLAVACNKSDSNKTAPAKTEPAPPPSGSNAFAGSSTGSSAGSSTTMAGSSGSGTTMAGSSAPAGSDAGSAVAAGSGAGSGSAFDFDKLDHKAQAQFMKDHVVQDMKVAFQGFDAKKFADFDCKTCHGKDAKAKHFEMPNPELPKLDFAAIQAGKQKPKMAEFMEKTVKPQMAKILQQPEFDPVAKTGKFGCLACHEQKK
jgi:hypothetical protein